MSQVTLGGNPITVTGAATTPNLSLTAASGNEGTAIPIGINATLADAMAARPDTVVFGEDVSRKGGVYGVTRGLRKVFGFQQKIMGEL